MSKSQDHRVSEIPNVADRMYARVREAKHSYKPRTIVLDNGNTAHVSICSCGATLGMSIKANESKELHTEHARNA
jgi:hypothetical protein